MDLYNWWQFHYMMDYTIREFFPTPAPLIDILMGYVLFSLLMYVIYQILCFSYRVVTSLVLVMQIIILEIRILKYELQNWLMNMYLRYIISNDRHPGQEEGNETQ